MAFCDPSEQLKLVAILAVLVAFFSATQDVVIDAYRIESADLRYQGAMAAAYVFGYRVALLMAGAGALFIADIAGWINAYRVMAALMCIGLVTTLCISEPDHSQANSLPASTPTGLAAWFRAAVIAPFIDFFKRNGSMAWLILLFIGVYRLSDITMGIMANPFYLDLGFSKTEIAEITKLYGFFMTIGGAALGGMLVLRFGIKGPIVIGAVMVAVTNLLFAWMAVSEPDKLQLAVVVSADNLSGGLASSVFIAYLSSLTNSAYTATQYALFSSLMTLPAKMLSGFSGVIVDSQGYFVFFNLAGAAGIPAIILSVYLLRKQQA